MDPNTFNPNPIAPTAPIGEHTNLKPVIALVVIVVLVVFGYLLLSNSDKGDDLSPKLVAESDTGALIQGFSPSLILVKDANILSSQHFVSAPRGLSNIFT